MTDLIPDPTRTEAARAAAMAEVLETDGVTDVFPSTFAVVRSLASGSASPTGALRLRHSRAGTEASIDIAVDGIHRATDVALAVQQRIHAVLIGHGLDLAFVAVTVLEHGRPETAPRP